MARQVGVMPKDQFQSSLPWINVQDFGAKGDGVSDDTVAIQAALDAGPIGVMIWFPVPTVFYRVTSVLTISVNRITLIGWGFESAVYFEPTINNTSLFVTTGILDNVTIQDLGLVLNNVGARTGISGLISNGDNSWKIKRVSFSNFNKDAINFTSCHYSKIIDCRLMNMDNSIAATWLANALRLITCNYVVIKGSRFASNDRALYYSAGTEVKLSHCIFELNGDSGNAFGIADTVMLSTISALHVFDCYFEANITGAGARVLNIEDCISPKIETSYLCGLNGVPTVSSILVGFTGVCTDPVLKSCILSEALNFLVFTAVALKLEVCYFFDGGVRLNTYATISPLINGIAFTTLSNFTEGFYGKAPIVQPALPAVPTPTEISTVLHALGLVS